MNTKSILFIILHVYLRKSKEGFAVDRLKSFCEQVVSSVNKNDQKLAKELYKNVVTKYMQEVFVYIEKYKTIKKEVLNNVFDSIPQLYHYSKAKTVYENISSTYVIPTRFKNTKGRMKFWRNRKLEEIKFYKGDFLAKIPLRARNELAELVCKETGKYEEVFNEIGLFKNVEVVFVTDGVCMLTEDPQT